MRIDTPAWEATVTARTPVTPGMVRLTLGDIRDLAGAPFMSCGRADEFLGLWVPGGSGGEAKRYYSLRAVRPSEGTLDIDFVLHGHGPGTEFGAHARPGDTVRFDAPRGHYLVPTCAERIVIAGDETALPAIGRILAERQGGVPATVLISVADVGDRQVLPIRPDDELTWERPDTLLDATIAAIDATSEHSYVWFSGEAADMRAVRRHLRHTLGRSVEHWTTMGYWRRDEAKWMAAFQEHTELPRELDHIYATETDDEIQRDLADALLERYGL